MRSEMRAAAAQRTACRDINEILYVEDNEDNIFMLKNRLSRAGHTVMIATDGAQGVAMAASERPDIILMDLSLPVLDGWEATRQSRPRPTPNTSP